MRHFMVCPATTFARLLREIRSSHSAWLVVGLNETAGECRWLVNRLVAGDTPPLAERGLYRVHVMVTTNPPPLDAAYLWADAVADGHLYLGDSSWRGQASGLIKFRNEILPFRTVRTVGAKLLDMPLLTARSGTLEKLSAVPALDATGPYSRFIGTLHPDWETAAGIWHRWTGLRVGVVGLGRTGSLLVSALARQGFHRLL